MNESTTHSSPPHSIEDQDTASVSTPPEIPTEIIPDEEELVLIEGAFASASRTPFPPLTQFHRNIGAARSITSISALSKKRFSSICCGGSDSVGDIEESARDGFGWRKKSKANESLLHRFRSKKGLSVTDITATEWCEKQMEFRLLFGRAKPTRAMKVGAARHAALAKGLGSCGQGDCGQKAWDTLWARTRSGSQSLAEEVVKRVTVEVTSSEDKWALKFINFIIGVNQLLFEGLTRELPLVSFEEGLWMVGIIDEIRMPKAETETERYATLVDTKTRVRASLPAEPQQRNGRLQLMCYKRLWDNLVADRFPPGQFFDFFALNPQYIVSSDIQDSTTKSGFPAETLYDLVNYYRNSCFLLPPAHEQLVLRYELQEDQSLLGEYQFAYDASWLNSQLKSCREFWLGERDPSYPPDEERWKCRCCEFSSKCPINADVGQQTSQSSTTEEWPFLFLV